MGNTYKTIKAAVLAGEHPTAEAINEAISHQLVAVATFANSVAKHSAKLEAAKHHPWPLATDQEGRVKRRADQFTVELYRLHRLHLWLELSSLTPVTAPDGLGS
jgi:hypothetical protein